METVEITYVCMFIAYNDLFPESLEILRRKATPKPILTGITKDEGLAMSKRNRIYWNSMGAR